MNISAQYRIEKRIFLGLLIYFPSIDCYKISHMHTPSSLLKFSKWTISTSLVNMSANCWSVAMCSRLTTSSSTRSLIKWWWMSICLVLLCWKGFFKIFMALMLLQNNLMTSRSTLYSFNICFIHGNWEQLLLATIYSTSTVDRKTRQLYLLHAGEYVVHETIRSSCDKKGWKLLYPP